MAIKYFPELEQGSEAWLQTRLGLQTASEMKLILTPSTLKYASNDKSRAHMRQLLAQRITNRIEPSYVSDDMMRGHEDEADARDIYEANVAPVNTVGFITNNKWGFTLGYSPDGLVGDDGLIEIKSRCPKHQVATIVNNAVPDEYILQLQTGLLVSERKWIDFISYSNGLPMVVIRVEPDPRTQVAIIEAVTQVEIAIARELAVYREQERSNKRLFPTVYKERIPVLTDEMAGGLYI